MRAILLFLLCVGVTECLELSDRDYRFHPVNQTIPTHEEVIFEKIKAAPYYLMRAESYTKSFGGRKSSPQVQSRFYMATFFNYNCSASSEGVFTCVACAPPLSHKTIVSKWKISATMWCEKFEGNERVVLTPNIYANSSVVEDSCRVVVTEFTELNPVNSPEKGLKFFLFALAPVGFLMLLCAVLCD